MKEKRKSSRMTFPIAADYAMNDDRVRYPAELRDCSGGGLKLEIARSLAVDQRVLLYLTFPTDPKPIALAGRVVWCRKIGRPRSGHWEVGVRYTRIKARDKSRYVLLTCEMMFNYMLGLREVPAKERG